MSKQRLNRILKMVKNSNNIQPECNTSSDLPLLTMKDIILNSEVLFEFPEIKDPNLVQNDHFNATQTENLETSVLSFSLTNNTENINDNMILNLENEVEDSVIVQNDHFNATETETLETSVLSFSATNNTDNQDQEPNIYLENENYNVENMNDNMILNLEDEGDQALGGKITQRCPNSNKKKWKKEKSKKNRMSGKEYIGYERIGKDVQHSKNRPARKIKDTCSSKKCQTSKNRFCNTFNEIRRLEIFKHSGVQHGKRQNYL